MTKKWVYQFNQNLVEGNRHQKELLGGKGANLAEMCSLGLPVPPGFVISTEACLSYYEHQHTLAEDIKQQILQGIQSLEKLTQHSFGGTHSSFPLLFSVRSGARISMPGMMDTVLNLGLNDKTVAQLASASQNAFFAWDSYRRFIQMYANVVMGLNHSLFETFYEDLKEARGYHKEDQVTAADLEELVEVYKEYILQEKGISFPQDPYEQLWSSIKAVFESWNNPRAKKYRELHNHPHHWGTAVNIQTMVFGNLGQDSATGVAFTRNPSTGEQAYFGEFLVNAQGEDVVAGLRTPWPLRTQPGENTNPSLEQLMPDIYKQLTEIFVKLEKHYRDMQDIEFTIQKGKLFILQTRNGKRSMNAAIKMAVDFVHEHMLTKQEALLRIKSEDLNQLLHPSLDPLAKKHHLATGLPASPGAACGRIYFDAEMVQKKKAEGQKCLLVRLETSPEDIAGMFAAEGILTARGGMTSHAAVVARGMGRPCVSGCHSLILDLQQKTLKIQDQLFSEGDLLTIDGGTGEIFAGEIPTIRPPMRPEFHEFMSWADEFRTLKIRANSDTETDTLTSLKYGAEGIGLCRTEHMFFDPERILAIREMIYAQDSEDRKKALVKILPYQKNDFVKLFQALMGKPLNIRLLDPPLHEFLPHTAMEIKELSVVLGKSEKEVQTRIQFLHETNPMLGHRGCRLGITFPEIYHTQVEAIIMAACQVLHEGIAVQPEIMIPLIISEEEFSLLRKDVEKIVQKIQQQEQLFFPVKIGTMIEVPRGALRAGDIARHADFFSFGTNDLTQTTLGLSRDDSNKFLPDYMSKQIFPIDPFVTIDEKGVGELVKWTITRGREVKNKQELSIGICGEHGGDPTSIFFFHKVGLDYVSCSPFRVPVARLAAAQAAIEFPQTKE